MILIIIFPSYVAKNVILYFNYPFFLMINDTDYVGTSQECETIQELLAGNKLCLAQLIQGIQFFDSNKLKLLEILNIL